MSDTFFEKSKEISNDYIQSIVFLDDRAYKSKDNESPNHDFDALKITQAFAKENKICAVYNPESDSDIENFKSIANKSDVIILDWQIVFPQSVEEGSEEEDAPDDPRGIYTKGIIKSILFEGENTKNSLKLIIVYTGDYTILESITEDIYKDVFNSSDMYILDKKDCSIQSSKIKILVRAKKTEINNDSNKEKYDSQMISYESMPSLVLDEFTKMTSGLLPNFALMSLTALRKNSSKILGLFSKEMDGAYLGHKATIPKQEDGEDLLIELFGDSVKDLLYYSKVNENLRNDLIEPWIDEKIVEEDFEFSKHKFKRSHNTLKSILKSGDEVVKNRFNTILSDINPQMKNHLMQNPIKIFTNNSDLEKVTDYDKNFCKLTHHKSLFIPKNTKPKLTLGTLIKSNKTDTYYICIQQKCDTVRIPKDNERKFLFIPLSISDDKFDILTPDGTKLKKNKDSYAIRTIKFVCNDESGVIAAVKDDDKLIFKQKYTTPTDEQFEWILDLKDLHSQRIIIDYTSQLSRVGLDESEWHRKQLS
ncbi:response regulator receiver domain [Chryseobacterium sp.]|uniref:response regulator receiver domain n=1 Tax=Chryseobacterium sp. TaxID=1871047 RepID=UPI0028974BBE|nr:response regulator receiver domain [Chryseobacterium sp.]